MEIKRIIKATSKALGVFMIFIVLYFVAAFVLSSVPVNADIKPCEKDAVEIYILTNGVHTDLVLPYRNQYMDWRKWVNPSHTKSCLLYTSPSPRDRQKSRMPSSA